MLRCLGFQLVQGIGELGLGIVAVADVHVAERSERKDDIPFVEYLGFRPERSFGLVGHVGVVRCIRLIQRVRVVGNDNDRIVGFRQNLLAAAGKQQENGGQKCEIFSHISQI